MGEKLIKPIHNIYKVYRKVNLVNPYLFSKPFVSTWRTSNTSAGSSTSTQVKLPLISTGSYNFVVSWGDGNNSTITAWNQVDVTHTYSIAGDYVITITGTCTGWQFNNTGDRLKLLSITTWGKLKLGNVAAFFYGCANMNLSGVTDLLDLTGTTTLTSLFRGCTALTTVGRINEWNTIAVTSMNLMFNTCSNFNQNIGAWNVSNVTTMNNMFSSATLFNNGGSNDIGNWTLRTSGANLSSMFSSASSFSRDITSWNTVGVTSMANTFQNATSFNQNIGSWNVSNVTSFNGMFLSSGFNNGGSSDINNWVLKTTGAIDMGGMFQNCSFNQPLNNWNTIAVTVMSNMFKRDNGGNTSFNQNIGSWNVSNVTSFNGMFLKSNTGTSVFNNGGSSDINNWTLKTTGTVDMTSMFQGAAAFNQPLNLWNTIAVTSMSSMFNNASAFNQNIGSWNVSNVTTFVSFMLGKTLANFSTINLDAIYNGWSTLVGGVKPSIVITFGTAKYTAASSAGRAILTGAPNNWLITDGGI